MKQKIIIITGATGSGKSKYAIELAQRINGVIINADAMQIYKDVPIITAQPSTLDKQIIPHFLYSCQDLDENDYSVGKYLIDLKNTLDKLQTTQPEKTPIIVGGTMLYIDAIINGLNEIPEIDKNIKNNIREKYKNKNVEEIFKDLQQLDNEYSKVVDKNNTQRLIRGIEVKLGTGKSILDFWQQKTTNIFTKEYTFEKYLIQHPRDILYERINNRFDKMVQEGAIDEVENIKKMIDKGKLDKTKLPKAIGLNHILDYLDKKITLSTAIDLSKRDSRHYAKRQMTWFNNRFSDFKKIEF